MPLCQGFGGPPPEATRPGLRDGGVGRQDLRSWGSDVNRSSLEGPAARRRVVRGAGASGSLAEKQLQLRVLGSSVEELAGARGGSGFAEVVGACLS